ncbi:hypothetical protein SteCoe_21849 [Stentor coeruleus]|uniref:Uncharacterized protein n=1 Tax=Stentor coeruleus TaxID=5963 RepID=A0A1R2BP62_9CILI|nr:hypothetical protein SteCoe_21849 [Stentor coeruleus]
MGSSNSSRTIKNNKDLALFMAVKEGSPEAVKILVHCENWKHLRISDTQWTLLHLASWYGHSELCKELILLGADPNAKDAHSETPLHLAVFRKHISTIKILAKYATEKNPTNIKGQTPLDLAEECGSEEIKIIVQEWNLRSATLRSATLNIVDI